MNATRLAYEDDELGVVESHGRGYFDWCDILFISFTFSESNGLVESVWVFETKDSEKTGWW